MRHFSFQNLGIYATIVAITVLVIALVLALKPTPKPTLPPTFATTSTPAASPYSTMAAATPTCTSTPNSTAAEETLTSTPYCGPDTDQIQTMLQGYFPGDVRGVTYEVATFPELYLLAVNTGETKTTVIEGPSGASWKLDMARFYYLHKDGTLDALWVVIGFTAGADPAYNTFNDLGSDGWYSSEEALKKLSTPGQIFYLTLLGRFVDQNGSHWDRCESTVAIIPRASCALGLVMDPTNSAEFFKTGIPPKGWVGLGFYLTPNSQISWVIEMPASITLPEICQ